ncbi:MAG: transglutaminase-like domain-containing protein [Pseudomonadota bacterium]
MTIDMRNEGAPEPTASRAITIEITGSVPEGASLLVPRPFEHWGERFVRFETTGVSAVEEVEATNSRCHAYWLTPAGETPPSLRYTFVMNDSPAPNWVWQEQQNRHTTAAPDLVTLAKQLAEGSTTERAALRRLIDNAAGIFDYGHVDETFNEGADEVPMLCGTTRGSCVDINTYLLAAARSLGIRGQYIAGYWFHPEKTTTADMHCWLAFEPDGKLVFWDLAHALKWRATLGASIQEGLNPAGGRRVGMSCGRGLLFDTAHGPVEISHFSEPVWIRDGEILPRADVKIHVDDPDGLRTQTPIAA